MKEQLERVTHIEDLSTLKRGNSGGRREREKDELVKKFIQDFFFGSLKETFTMLRLF